MASTVAQDTLFSAFEQMIQKFADEAREEAIKRAVAEYEERLREECGRAAFRLANYYEMHMDRGVLNIRVKVGDL